MTDIIVNERYESLKKCLVGLKQKYIATILSVNEKPHIYKNMPQSFLENIDGIACEEDNTIYNINNDENSNISTDNYNLLDSILEFMKINGMSGTRENILYVTESEPKYTNVEYLKAKNRSGKIKYSLVNKHVEGNPKICLVVIQLNEYLFPNKQNWLTLSKNYIKNQLEISQSCNLLDLTRINSDENFEYFITDNEIGNKIFSDYVIETKEKSNIVQLEEFALLSSKIMQKYENIIVNMENQFRNRIIDLENTNNILEEKNALLCKDLKTAHRYIDENEKTKANCS